MITTQRACEILLEESQRLEPCQAEVCADNVETTKVVYENTDFSMVSSSQATVLGLRVILNNRVGFITTNSLDEKHLREAAREAQLIAKLSPENPHFKLAGKQDVSGNFQLVDKKLSEARPKDLIEWIEFLVTSSRSDSKILLDRAEGDFSRQTRWLMNSNGVNHRMDQTTFGWFVMGMAKDKDGPVTSMDYDGDTVSNYSQIEKGLAHTADIFRESVLGSLGASHGKSYKGKVLLHPSAVGDLMVGVVQHNINARAQQDGMSKWADKIGKKVAHESLSIWEKPLDTSRCAGWTPFDREGVLCKDHEIIGNGNLKFTAHNCFTASRGNTISTGNAGGGSRSLPAISLRNVTVLPGSQSLESLYKDMGEGLVLKRFSGNEDPIAGNFSGVAKNSWWVTGGKRSHALKEVMISGNMFDLLSDVKGISKEVLRHFGSLEAPYILVDNVSVTSQ